MKRVLWYSQHDTRNKTREAADFEFSVGRPTIRRSLWSQNGDVLSSSRTAERFRPSSVPEIPEGIARLPFLLLPRFFPVTHNEMTEWLVTSDSPLLPLPLSSPFCLLISLSFRSSPALSFSLVFSSIERNLMLETRRKSQESYKGVAVERNDSSLGPQFTSRQVIANGRTTWYRCLATGLRWRKYLDGRITVAHIYSHCSRAFPLFDSCELTIAPSPRQLISHRNPSPCQLCQFRSLRNPAIFLAGWRLPDPSYAVERDRQIATNCATPFRGRSNRSARVS